MKSLLASFLLASALLTAPGACVLPAGAQGSTTAIEEIASAGPFTATTRHRQRFYGQFKLAPNDLNKTLTLVIHNGIGGNPGFNWIRALIGSDMDISHLRGADEPSADLVYDENYIQRHTVSIDLTGKVFSGVNTVIIEGAAPKGAVMSWVLQGPVTPEFANINPTTAQIGGRLTLAGRGFSVDPSENHVSIGGRDAQLLSSSRNSLTVRVPSTLIEGHVDVIITTNNVCSAPYTISVSH